MWQVFIGMLIGCILILLVIQCSEPYGIAVCYSGGREIYRGPYVGVNLFQPGISIPSAKGWRHHFVLGDCITGVESKP